MNINWKKMKQFQKKLIEGTCLYTSPLLQKTQVFVQDLFMGKVLLYERVKVLKFEQVCMKKQVYFCRLVDGFPLPCTKTKKNYKLGQ